MATIARSIDVLYAKLGDKVKENVLLAPYTSARIGGPADILITADTAAELGHIMKLLRKQEMPFTLLGCGSNVLVSDKGVRGVGELNRAKAVKFHTRSPPEGTLEA